MIDWSNVPRDQAAEIYLPAVDADAVIAKATELYRVERLTRVDAHTIGCTREGSLTFRYRKARETETNSPACSR